MSKSIKNFPPKFVDRYPPPDPDWDYYETWMKLVEAVCEIEQALDLIKIEKQADNDCNLETSQHIEAAIVALGQIGFDLEEGQD